MGVRMTADLLLVDRAWQVTIGRQKLVCAIEARLSAQGRMIELRQLQGLSASEMDALVYRELHAPSVADDLEVVA